MVSQKIIGRLSQYRRYLAMLRDSGEETIFSHELARASGGTAAQVRRDMMAIGATGSPTRGYIIVELIEAIRKVLDSPGGQNAALVGVGNLGRALLHYFMGRRPNLRIAIAFDTDPDKTGRVIHGCRCLSFDEMEAHIRENGIRVGIIAVPSSAAQAAAEALVRAGAKGILNFAPVPLRVPEGVYLEDIDMTMSLEKVAYYAR